MTENNTKNDMDHPHNRGPRAMSIDFSVALHRLIEGYSVHRKGWKEKANFIKLDCPNEISKMTGPYIYMYTKELESDNLDAHKLFVPWEPRQADLLASDWEIC